MPKKFFFDIETLPADASQYEKLQKVYDRKQKKGNKIGTFEEFAEATNFDGTWGRVLCISYAFDQDKAQCLWGDEREIIKKFWEIAMRADLFVGFNVFDFDLRFIYQRSVILGVRPSRDLSFARYRNNPIFDVMYEWTKWGGKISMDELAHALDIPSSKGDMDGSQVHEYFKKEKFAEIQKYCNLDVEVTRSIYSRMIFNDRLL